MFWRDTEEEDNAFYACNDGVDADGDGLIDTEDPGCSTAFDNDEYHVPECQDGIDNDGDGWIDLADLVCEGEQISTKMMDLVFMLATTMLMMMAMVCRG